MNPGADAPSREAASASDAALDEILLASCSAGNTRALARLHDRHYAALYRYAGRLLGPNHPDREDLVQQLFLTVWEHADRYRPEVSVRAWMFGIGANLAKRHFQSQRRRMNGLLRFFAEPRPAAATAPDQDIDLNRWIEALPAAIAKLPLRLSVVYVMVELEGVSTQEAAKALGLRVGTVWSRMHEARAELRYQLSREA